MLYSVQKREHWTCFAFGLATATMSPPDAGKRSSVNQYTRGLESTRACLSPVRHTVKSSVSATLPRSQKSEAWPKETRRPCQTAQKNNDSGSCSAPYAAACQGAVAAGTFGRRASGANRSRAQARCAARPGAMWAGDGRRDAAAAAAAPLGGRGGRGSRSWRRDPAAEPA